MPPNTAMRVCSGIASSAGSIGTDGPILVTGVTGMMAERVGGQGFLQGRAKTSVWRFNQDRADVHALVRDDPAVVAHQLALVEPLHHVGRDPFLHAITPLSFRLGPDPQRWQDFDSRP